jgi:7-cyano-7-deazaguanine synthase
MHTVAVVSGGMDSVTLASMLAHDGDEITLISFDYGQRHRKELTFAAACAKRLGADHEIADLSSINQLLAGSSLTSDEIEVPDGHYAEESMKATVVPNRNAIMISVAGGLAVSRGADRVAVGVHGGDHFIYPDCRPGFIDAMDLALSLGNDEFAPAGFGLIAPFIDVSKTEIARIGDALGVPWAETWSCYKGGDLHCGTCGTCVERREAFDEADVEDPTEYLHASESGDS